MILIGIATSVKDAKELISKSRPDLIFLDIDLPDGTGFDIIDKDNPITYEVIFTTSFNEFAVRAFEFSALHYLLKPIETEQLIESVNRFLKTTFQDNFISRFNILKESITDKPQKIMLPSNDGFNLYIISDIMLCEADSNYTTIYFNNGEKTVVSKHLQQLDVILSNLGFARAHNKYLVNLRYIKKYKKNKHGEVVLTNGTEIPISITYRIEFEEKIKEFAKLI
jgi:two-component system LytT family response regulator